MITQIVVLNNINVETFRTTISSASRNSCGGGGGALWIAGERNVYIDHKGAPKTPWRVHFRQSSRLPAA